VKKGKEGISYRKTLWYWGPVVIWMVIIFIGSSHQNVVVSETHDNLIKNLAHIGEYAILGFLIFRAFFNREKNSFLSKYAWLWALIGAILYGVSDEIHQMFISTRTACMGDILMDGIGASLGQLFAIVVYLYFLKKNFFVNKCLRLFRRFRSS